MDWKAVDAAWKALETQLGPLELQFDEQNARRVGELVDALLTQTAAEGEAPGLESMLDALSDWLRAYEETRLPMGASDPVGLLVHLMEENGLRQKDLASILGGQPVVSAILSKRRRINGRQALALGRRFNLSPAAFLSADDAPEDSMPTHHAERPFGIELGSASERKPRAR